MEYDLRSGPVNTGTVKYQWTAVKIQALCSLWPLCECFLCICLVLFIMVPIYSSMLGNHICEWWFLYNEVCLLGLYMASFLKITVEILYFSWHVSLSTWSVLMKKCIIVSFLGFTFAHPSLKGSTLLKHEYCN